MKGVLNTCKNIPVKSVRIVEVGLRDGLQNEKRLVPLQSKLKLLNHLEKSGLTSIEVGSFVSPKWVPQMADTEALFQHIELRKLEHDRRLLRMVSGLPEEKESLVGFGVNGDNYYPEQEISYAALTPNMKGLEAALLSNVREIAVFGAASESFSKKNINCSIDESIDRFASVCETAQKIPGMKIRGYVSCVLGCPYEGPNIDPEKVLHVTKKLLNLGCYEVSLGDTIGVGTAGSTARLLDVLLREVEPSKLAVHFHDTYGQALSNILMALSYGINVVDSSISGLGGCPYASGASGNVATEDVVYMLNGMGIDTGLSIDGLFDAACYIDSVLDRRSGSKYTQATLSKMLKAASATS